MILSDDVISASHFYTDVLGFTAHIVTDWYASHSLHDDATVFIDIVKIGHVAAGEALKTETTSGVMIAIGTDNCDTRYGALRAEHPELYFISAPTDEPWGQRRFQLRAPDGVVIEYVQRIEPDQAWMRAQGI
jgi:catechol 2,3-dioxygenase-like lactoylglutathione lyase family enzyme